MAPPSGTGRPTASDPLNPGADTERWSARHVIALVVVFAAGIVIRALLLPGQGLKGDLDQFVLWVHGIAVNGLGNAYEQNLSFPAVMAWVWGVLALLEPAFRTVTDSADPWIRTVMKLPATLADIGMALLMIYAFRGRPFWAVVAAAIVMLHPAIIDVSAWWGQYESIYLLFALTALIFAIEGRNGLAALFLAVCLMTKPQALPFVLPFAAWFWTHGGWREIVRTASIGLVTILILWLPFLAAGGPVAYLRNLAEYQSVIFPILSLNAWNIWWLVQIFAVGGFASDQIAILGPITFRYLGFAITAILSIVVAAIIVRNPRPRTLILGLTASTLIWYGFLTQMHERYAYGALVFLLLLIPERRVQWLYLAFGVVFMLNLWSAVPPLPIFRVWLPYPGVHSLVGALAMIAITGIVCLWIGSAPEDSPDTLEGSAETPDHRVAVTGGGASV